jgi:glycine/D-amino acid oxidase-like deaminating enzyme
MIEELVAAGAQFVQGRVTDVVHDDIGVRSVSLDNGAEITTDTFVNAAGPLIAKVGQYVGVELPVRSEIHQKVSFKDHKQAFPRTAPMVIWNDPQRLAWDDDVRRMLIDSGYEEAVGVLPPFVHGRPEGGSGSEWALGLWEWRTLSTDRPSWPMPEDPLYPELVMRGLSSMLPAMAVYSDALPSHTVDGGYYTKTVENMPIVGPVGPSGSFVCGALSGYGIMAACAVGELAALHIAGRDLPSYADACDLRRYDDAAYVKSLASLGSTGQI